MLMNLVPGEHWSVPVMTAVPSALNIPFGFTVKLIAAGDASTLGRDVTEPPPWMLGGAARVVEVKARLHRVTTTAMAVRRFMTHPSGRL
jgi:hypothetical protein